MGMSYFMGCIFNEENFKNVDFDFGHSLHSSNVLLY